MRFRKHLLLLILTSLSCFARSQDIPQELQLILEQFLEDQELEEFDVADIIIRLQSYQNEPLNINTASYEDLKDLLLLNDLQIQEIISHRLKYGDLLSLEELQSIPSMDISSIRRVAPFLSVKDPNKFNYGLGKMLTEGKNQVFLKWRSILEDQKGYIPDAEGETAYAGDQNRYFVRYRHNYENRLRYGFTLEKDPGEDFFTGSNKQGFDYMTGHFYLKEYSSFLKDFVIGDYSMSFGQGLIDHNDFGSGKSSWVTNIKKGGRAIKPYNSVNENDFFRGAAATLRLTKKIELSLMGSYKNLDATVADDLEEGPDNTDLEISTIRIDGFHRTESEIRNEKSISGWQAGSILKYTERNFHLALNFLHQNFQANFIPNNRLYDKFQEIPSQLNNISFDYSYRINNFHFFGEAATNDAIDWGNLHGLLLGLDKTVSMAFLYRKYSPGYISISPNAFGESANNENEQGFYAGIEIRPVYAWKFAAYADLWNNPWLKFQIDRPSDGKEFLLRLDYIIKRKLNIYAQYTYEQKERNFNPDDFGTNSLANVDRHKLRIHLGYKINKEMEVRSRLELNFFDHSTNSSRGMLLYQDFIYRPISSPWRITARYAIFDTDDFNSRIYAYENDILYEFFIPAYANKGSRFYVNFRYDITRWLTSEFRIARTQFENINQISSGNNQIDGDTQTECKAQLVFKF